jgi:hypothetical protein
MGSSAFSEADGADVYLCFHGDRVNAKCRWRTLGTAHDHALRRESTKSLVDPFSRMDWRTPQAKLEVFEEIDTVRSSRAMTARTSVSTTASTVIADVFTVALTVLAGRRTSTSVMAPAPTSNRKIIVKSKCSPIAATGVDEAFMERRRDSFLLYVGPLSSARSELQTDTSMPANMCGVPESSWCYYKVGNDSTRH